MWRYGFNTPTNVNDHESNCGGFGRQWSQNQGLCGVCGDAYDLPQPRPGELGGQYGLGVVAANLSQAQVLQVEVELTAYHGGYFEFRLCPHNTRTRPVAQRCLDRHLLTQESGEVRFYPGPPSPGGRYSLTYSLPPHLTCGLCVLQWRYVAGNSWGKCTNGTEAVGCGAQEEFRACADLTVRSSSGYYDNTPNTDTDTDGRVAEYDDTRPSTASRPDLAFSLSLSTLLLVNLLI